jgi:hypothetical protein
MEAPKRLPDEGLDNVRAEFSLTALAHNLRQAINILGVDAMMAVIQFLSQARR